MAPHISLDALNAALNAEFMQWGGSESANYSRRRGRTLAALVFGASTVVGVPEQPRTAPIPSPQSTTEAAASGGTVLGHDRAASGRVDSVIRMLTHAQARAESGGQSARPVAALALEIGRLQRDLAACSAEGMEESIGEAYASLEAVRRAVADVVVDAEDSAVVAVALDRAAQLVIAA